MREKEQTTHKVIDHGALASGDEVCAGHPDEHTSHERGAESLHDALRRRIRITVILIAITSLACVVGLFLEIYLPHARFSGVKMVTITPTLGSRKIGALLRSEGVIRSKWAFVTYATFKGQASMLKPGTYAFNDRVTIPFIVAELVSGDAGEVSVVIPEGWTVKDIATALESKGLFSKQEFAAYIKANYDQLAVDSFDFLPRPSPIVTLEGYLFPDTYRVYEHGTPGDVLVKMLTNFDERVTDELRFAAKERGRSLHEVIIMASLIEKEVISDHDRAIVSGILWKRLRIGMPLQVDSSIAYITGKNSTKISLAETRIQSPYNTYRNKGLPIAPISNPGISAIRAAIFPQDSSYLYYLSAPDGETIFSSTLEEHVKAKKSYLK